MSNSTGIDSAKNQSSHTFFTSLWLNLLIFAAELVAFTYLRVGVKSIYEPRTIVGETPQRELTRRWYAWPLAILSLKTGCVKDAGLDSYFFLRFLRMMIIAFVPIWILSWLILLPINGSGETLGHSGLNRFTIGNISTSQQGRYWAHLLCLWLFTIWICYLINSEMRFFIAQRQKYLVDDKHKSSNRARTLLVSGIPAKDMNVGKLEKIFSVFGPVEHVFLLRDYSNLLDLYQRRAKALNALEAAETKLIARALKRSSTLPKNDRADNTKRGRRNQDNTRHGLSGDGALEPTAAEGDIEIGQQTTHELLPKDQRPTRRLSLRLFWLSLPFFGKKVDTIQWACEKLNETTKKLVKEREIFLESIKNGDTKSGGEKEIAGGKHKLLRSAFIVFEKQISVYLAYQSVIHTEPYTMSVKSVEVSPRDIVWSNLKLSNYDRKIRQVASTLMTVGLIMLWSFPVALVGATSNVSSLCQSYRWLSWICKIGPTAIGIIQGILPPVLLAILMILLPVIFRIMGRFEGIPRESKIELSVMIRFFSFQVINSFLIVTLSSGLIASLPGLIKNPTSIAGLLATNLPQASNFFLSYTILQGLTGTATGFLQIGPLIIYYIQRMFVVNTPRSMYHAKFTIRSAQWGAVFPPVTLIAVISIAYSVISPVINVLALVTFILFFLLWRYLFIYQYEEPKGCDTGGLFFPLAIQHVFVGLYIQQLCLAALFFLARNGANNAGAIYQGGLTIVLIFVTAMFHMLLNNSYAPLIHSLPVTMADKSFKIDPSDRGRTLVGDPVDFCYPAVNERLAAVWLPDDKRNFTEQEIEQLQSVLGENVASCKNATIDMSGHVKVTGPPPEIERSHIGKAKGNRDSGLSFPS